jgi:hypothetical protein
MTGKKNLGQKRHESAVTTPKIACTHFCSYYKPEKADDLACRGFMIIERLMRGGRRFSLPEDGAEPDRGVSEMLSARVCAECPFREDGCDFAAAQEGARPCGGFILLGLLVGSGELDVDDI